MTTPMISERQPATPAAICEPLVAWAMLQL